MTNRIDQFSLNMVFVYSLLHFVPFNRMEWFDLMRGETFWPAWCTYQWQTLSAHLCRAQHNKRSYECLCVFVFFCFFLIWRMEKCWSVCFYLCTIFKDLCSSAYVTILFYNGQLYSLRFIGRFFFTIADAQYFFFNELVLWAERGRRKK